MCNDLVFPAFEYGKIYGGIMTFDFLAFEVVDFGKIIFGILISIF